MAEGLKATQLSRRIVKLLRSGGIPMPAGVEEHLYLRRVRRGRANESVAWQLVAVDDASVMPFDIWSTWPATEVVASKKVVFIKASSSEYEIHIPDGVRRERTE